MRDKALFSKLNFIPICTNPFQTEWVQKSAIALSIFNANVTTTSDEVITYGGETSYPLHEALNWSVTRWRTSSKGRLQRPEQNGAIIHTLDPITGDRIVFQVKLEKPILDPKKGKLRKYENPTGRGQVGGFPYLDLATWCRIATRFNVPLPANLSNQLRYGQEFWNWVINFNLPIIICEGFKKACCLLTHGYPAIALSGITMGRLQLPDGTLNLQPYLKIFATPKREIFFCFDAESKPKTLLAVHTAQIRTGNLFVEAGCLVKTIQLPLLPNSEKTGVDDFIVAQGSLCFDHLYKAALPLNTYAWQWHQQQEITHNPSLLLNAADLSTINIPGLPSLGIIALASPKGTGKTKAIGKILGKTDKLLLLGHRVSLMRNLCQRLGADFKGDLDKASGQFITDDAYTLRIGACVDSLLSFDPKTFKGCDLVLDEVEQVLKHLISGSTCNKDGKRPALLALLQILVKNAKRVIIADADLSDRSINYLKAIRGEDSPVFLIKNEYKPQGYPVEIIRAKTPNIIYKQLLSDIIQGKKAFITTDSLATSRVVNKIIQQIHSVRPQAKILLINSETSGGQVEAEFIRDINNQVQNYDVVIATPSMSTGVSIEVDWFDCVYGIFHGILSDGEICQALARVRAKVPRLVWCPEVGKNFSKLDRSTFPHRLKNILMERWDREASLIKAGLGSALLPSIASTNWECPHIKLWAEVEANHNFSMWTLQADLIERLKDEGNLVKVVETDKVDKAITEVVKTAKYQVKYEQYRAIAEADILSVSAIKALANQETRSPLELLSERKTAIANFYCTDNVNLDLIEYDQEAKRRAKIIKLEALVYKRYAMESDLEVIAKQVKFGYGIFVPDQPCNELEKFVRDNLGLAKLLVPNVKYTNTDLTEIGDICRRYASDIKAFLNFKIPENSNNIWIFRRLCHQLGIKIASKRVHHTKRMVNYCWIEETEWAKLQEILRRREAKRLETHSDRSINDHLDYRFRNNDHPADDQLPNKSKNSDQPLNNLDQNDILYKNFDDPASLNINDPPS